LRPSTNAKTFLMLSKSPVELFLKLILKPNPYG
jgi:hypothetical protein